MTMTDLSGFVRQAVPESCRVVPGKNDMMKVAAETGAEAYIKYTGGLDFQFQGKNKGSVSPIRNLSFKNEFVMCSVLVSLVYELLDGVRRV